MRYFCELDKRDIEQAIAKSLNCDVKDVSLIVEYVTVHSSTERTEHSIKARVKTNPPKEA